MESGAKPGFVGGVLAANVGLTRFRDLVGCKGGRSFALFLLSFLKKKKKKKKKKTEEQNGNALRQRSSWKELQFFHTFTTKAKGFFRQSNIGRDKGSYNTFSLIGGVVVPLLRCLLALGFTEGLSGAGRIGQRKTPRAFAEGVEI